MRAIGSKVRKDPKRVVFADAENAKILKTAQLAVDEGIAYPILLGDPKKIMSIAEIHNIDLEGIPMIDPKHDDLEDKRQEYGEVYFSKRQRRGVNFYEAYKKMKDRNHFGCMMVEMGDADAMISGLTRNYADTIKPAIQIIGTEEGVDKIAGMSIMLTNRGPLFLADTTVNFNPTSEELANITLLVAREVRSFGITPRVAMLSYSNFGSSNTAEAIMVRDARALVKQRNPSLIVDGEIQGIMAFNKEILRDNYPFSELLKGDVNTLIFPNLSAGNIAYNLLQEVGGADSIGPVLLGLKKPVHVLQLGSSVRSIFNMVMIAGIDAQQKSALRPDEKARDSEWVKKFIPGLSPEL
jgi:malate dehydrogenase (oxaloacetate-decarboxylating)(NADP+)